MAVAYHVAGGKAGGSVLVLCLSGDVKPPASVGMFLIETDTGAMYFGGASAWSQAGGGEGGSAAPAGVAVLDFGAFPGASDASVIITGQAGILSGSVVNVWINAVSTPDHSAMDHIIDPPRVIAGEIVPGTGFTIYGFTTNATRHFGQYSVAWTWS